LPRRVVFLAWAPFFSGAERALLLTVQHLDPARYRPFVILGSDGDTLRAFRDAGIDCEHVPLDRLEWRRPWRGAAAVYRIFRTLRRTRASILHSNDAPSYRLGGIAARLHGVPSLTHIRFPDVARGFAWFLRPPPAEVLFVSDALRKDGLRVAPDVFEGRATVMHDGVALPPALSNADRLALKQSLGLPANEVVIAMSGQVSEIKGIWEFVAAAGLLTARNVTATFAVLGDDLKHQGAARKAMEARVEAEGLADRFRFLGFRPDAPALIPAFDIVAVPSHVEPLGNATLEAMSAGRPVVGSRVGGIPEMVVDGETGYLVPPRDPAALADALEALIRDPSLIDKLGRAGRARAESHFSLAVHAARLQSVYDRVLGPAG
jgi:glycosyltransferase involved in cell wall biosynthesis